MAKSKFPEEFKLEAVRQVGVKPMRMHV